MLTPVHIIGILLTVGLLLVVSVLSGRKVKDAKSFTTGGRSGSWMVCGAILGTLVGGQSTIGTAQLAFSFGISSWWFTIGAALGALVLALVYARPLRESDCSTLLEIVSRQYGRRAETVGSVLFLIGIFISIMSQVLSSSAMVTSLFHIPLTWAAVVSAVLIMLFVLFGGNAVLALLKGVFHHFKISFVDARPDRSREHLRSELYLNSYFIKDRRRIKDYGNMVARGALKDIGGCLSLMLGVVTTQTYAQGIWSAASTPKARRGAIYCACLIPIIGAACTLVGMYMRGHYVTTAELAALQAAGHQLPEGIGVIEGSLQAFPAFVLNYLPAWIGGICLGAMLVNILGCGSGLTLGAATILVRDVVDNLRQLRVSRQFGHRLPRAVVETGSSALVQTRLAIVAILTLAVVVALSVRGTFINDLGFLSLGLRAVALLFPLSFALFLPGRFRANRVVPAMVAGTAVMLLAKFFSLPADPIYYGLGINALVMLSGLRTAKGTKRLRW